MWCLYISVPEPTPLQFESLPKLTFHPIALRQGLLTEIEANPSLRLASELLEYSCFYLPMMEFQTLRAMPGIVHGC